MKNEKYASRACAPRVPRRIPFVSVVMTGGYVIPAIIHPLNGQVDYETLFTIYDSIHYYPSPSFSFFHLSDRLNMRVLIAFFSIKKNPYNFHLGGQAASIRGRFFFIFGVIH